MVYTFYLGSSFSLCRRHPGDAGDLCRLCALRIRVGYTLRQKVVGNIGKRFSNDHGLSMTDINDGTNEGLVVAYSDGAAELYYIDLQAEALSVGKLGNVGQASAIAAPYVTTNPPESSVIFFIREGTEGVCSTPVPCVQSEGVEVPMGDPTLGFTPEEDTEQAAGTLNAMGTASEQAEPDSGAGGSQGTVQLTLTEAQAVTNGLLEIRYAPATLHCEGMDSAIGNTALRQDPEAGFLIFDYAAARPMEAGCCLPVPVCYQIPEADAGTGRGFVRLFRCIPDFGLCQGGDDLGCGRILLGRLWGWDAPPLCGPDTGANGQAPDHPGREF